MTACQRRRIETCEVALKRWFQNNPQSILHKESLYKMFPHYEKERIGKVLVDLIRLRHIRRHYQEIKGKSRFVGYTSTRIE